VTEAASGLLRGTRRFSVWLTIAGLVLLCVSSTAIAQTEEIGSLLKELTEQFSAGEVSDEGSASLSGRIIQLFALITVMSIAPGLLVVMTSFTRFVIVFSMLRSALGLNQTPPNIVLNAMALFMTLFVMQPVFDDSWNSGLRPLLLQNITEEQAVSRITKPFLSFMEVNTRAIDLTLFRNFAASTDPEQALALSDMEAEPPGFRVMVPSFMISELRRAFTIGFLLYLPFIAIDLIVASVLMSAGMMMLPPVIVSLPFKVIFFVLIDGWYMLAGSMMESYIPYVGAG